MIIAILLAIAAIVFMLWLLFALAIYALPFFAAVSVGLWASSTGAGPLGAIGLGLGAGVATLIAGQVLFATVRSPILRFAIALIFAVPAGVAGYHAVLGIAALGVPSESWRLALAWAGALIVGACAWGKIASFAPAPSAAPRVPPGAIQAGGS